MAVGILRVELEDVVGEVPAPHQYVRLMPGVVGVLQFTIDAEIMEIVRRDPARFSELLAKKVREMVTGLAEELS